MVGLWNVRQIAMLGLQFQADSLRPKILALVNYSIHMCYLKPLKLSDFGDVTELIRLLIAFVTFVKTFMRGEVLYFCHLSEVSSVFPFFPYLCCIV